MSEKTLIIGMAGHVDHGKTALIKALTGLDLDKNPDEKRRGITINPGYTTLELGRAIVFFVDVPGHRAYLRNTIMGLWGTEAAILVIASDEGVMPQTREHLAILEILGVSRGIIALTKTDIADEEIIFMAEDEVRELTKGTFLEDAEIVHFSAKTGEGKKELIKAVEGLTGDISRKDLNHPFMMPIDTVFAADGYGTVVTGPVVSGRIETDARVNIYPGERPGQIRLIQSGRRTKDRIERGMRAGVNLKGISHNEIRRGMVLGEPESLFEGRFVNIELSLLDDLRSPVKNHDILRVFWGSLHTQAQIVLMEDDMLLPGSKALCQLRFNEEMAGLPFFPVIVATLSPVRILGGGTILEISKIKWRKKQTNKKENLTLIKYGTLQEIIASFINESSYRPLSIKEIALRSGRSAHKIKAQISSMTDKRQIISIGDRFYDTGHFKASLDRMTEIVSAWNLKRHELPGLPMEEIRSRLSHLEEELRDSVIEAMKKDDRLETVEGGLFRVTGFTPFLSERLERISSRIMILFQKSAPKPITFSTLCEKFNSISENDMRKIVSFLVQENKLIKIYVYKKGNREEYLRVDTLHEIKKNVSRHIARHGRLTFEDSVKAIPIGRLRFNILDYLDSIKFTRQLDDMSRVLSGS